MSVADPAFPVGGNQPRRGRQLPRVHAGGAPLDLPIEVSIIFSWTLHDIVKIWHHTKTEISMLSVSKAQTHLQIDIFKLPSVSKHSYRLSAVRSKQLQKTIRLVFFLPMLPYVMKLS